MYNPASQENQAVISALLASGFRRIPDDRTDSIYYKFLPCPLGTFSNSSSKGADGCIECPPGIKSGSFLLAFRFVLFEAGNQTCALASWNLEIISKRFRRPGAILDPDVKVNDFFMTP